MMCDALFQLGMGPVVLEATQTEEPSSMPLSRARDASLRDTFAGMTTYPREFLRRSFPYPRYPRRGNSAKALTAAA